MSEPVSQIDALIADGEASVARQRERLEHLRWNGAPADQAQYTLALMVETLNTIRGMRDGYARRMQNRIH